MSTSGQDFGAASKPQKHLSEYNPDDVKQAIATGDLWSEELSRAAHFIVNTENPKVKDSFDKLATTLLSPPYTEKGGRGFGLRDALGHAIQDMDSEEPDLARFSRLLADTDGKLAGDEALHAKIELLAERLERHQEKEGLDVRDGYNPETKTITFASGQTL